DLFLPQVRSAQLCVVSILTPPRGGVRQAELIMRTTSGHDVSILTPPRGGVRLPNTDAFPASRFDCFNPHSAPRRSATRPRSAARRHGRPVSILTPPRGGVRRMNFAAWLAVK